MPAAAACIVDLRQLTAFQLDALLREETAEWTALLDWDFSQSANLIRAVAATKSLGGAALLIGGEPAGYGYTGIENQTGTEKQKGIIAGIYVRPPWRGGGHAEAALFRVLLDALAAVPGISRVESQLMLTNALPHNRPIRAYERILMARPASAQTPPAAGFFRLEPWHDRHFEAAAAIASQAYAGHIDAQFNDHYRNKEEATRSLRNLVNFPGSASFCPPASFIAFDPAAGQPAGIVLSSFIAPEVAHIAEICVAPYARHAGLGRQLLLRSIAALHNEHARRISLAVTATSETALRLYQRCGFTEIRRFYACLWESASCKNDSASA